MSDVEIRIGASPIVSSQVAEEYIEISTTSTLSVYSGGVFVSVTNAAAITITLPDISSNLRGVTYTIKDSNGLAATRNITVQCNNGFTIDGETNYIIKTPYECLKLLCNGKWYKV